MSFLDRLAIRAALAANPELRSSVVNWIEHVSGEPIPAVERDHIERSLTDALRVAEATKFASFSPTPALPAVLSPDLMNTILNIVDRMGEPARSTALGRIKSARASGRLQVST
jgi:hypothetical protein